jgi:hypothetical protein
MSRVDRHDPPQRIRGHAAAADRKDAQYLRLPSGFSDVEDAGLPEISSVFWPPPERESRQRQRSDDKDRSDYGVQDEEDRKPHWTIGEDDRIARGPEVSSR